MIQELKRSASMPLPRHALDPLSLRGPQFRVADSFWRKSDVGSFLFNMRFWSQILTLTSILGGYLIGDRNGRAPTTNIKISLGDFPDTVMLPSQRVLPMLGVTLWFPGLSRFREWIAAFSRNSYGSLLLHIYELVKLGSNWIRPIQWQRKNI